MEVNCIVCGKSFTAVPAELTRGLGKFCSQACVGAWKSSHAETTYSRGKGGKRADLDNRYFRSSWEANYARYLNWLISLGEIAAWDYEADTFEFVGIKRGTRFYTPDFRIRYSDGRVEYHEIKGWMDAESATKLKRMAKYYPDIKLILIDKPAYQALARDIRGFIANWESRRSGE